MIITDLTIMNLRSHRRTEISGLQAINWFVGQNYSGKSTIIDAMNYLFRGVCRGTDEGGKGAKELVSTDKHGKLLAESFHLEAKTDHGTLRRVGPGHGPRSNVQISVDKVVAAGASRVIDPRLLITNGLFLNMDEATQRRHVTALLAPAVDVQEIITILGEEWMLIEPLGLDWKSVDDIDTAEKHARAQRKSLKDQLSMVKPFDEHAYPEQIRKLSREEAVSKLAGVKDRLAELRTKSKAEASERGETTGRVTILRNYLETEEKGLAGTKWRNEKQAFAIDIPEKEYEQLVKQREELAGEIPELDVLDSRIYSLEKKHKGKASCWTCGREFQAGQREKLLKDLEGEKTRGLAAQEALRNLSAKIGQLRVDINHWKEARKNHASYVTAIQTLKRQIADAEKGAKQAASKKAVDYGPNIEKGEGLLAALQSYVDAMAQRSSTDEEVRQMRADLAKWERACELLAPKGQIRSSVIGTKSAELVSKLNETASRFGMNFTIELDPFRLLVNGRKSSLLSTSEQLRAGLAFQVAAAKLSGLNFACLDNLDILDGPGRSVFTKVIKEGIIGQLFVAATLKVSDEEFKAPDIPGWRFYLVQGSAQGSVVKAL